ncbi:hypothetical protein B0T26DRAFT_678622 [Lasiosphaeria miniovina]|uniref:Uncharacterized protein n=1 Tax=Lasiosphaeria miniovina TaxID=1954250 RepID=A0AA40DN08_9PEZI|nr:uncharacterized protein B0T26DRAFT_678622 [Lasiosphaeria miniovina]KAK0709160.1 hypothetical protein B0T26DRAFT_678622 [Lasiosphaeria miniovina]
MLCSKELQDAAALLLLLLLLLLTFSFLTGTSTVPLLLLAGRCLTGALCRIGGDWRSIVLRESGYRPVHMIDDPRVASRKKGRKAKGCFRVETSSDAVDPPFDNDGNFKEPAS